MKTKTVTVREGEYLGPVNWDYDFHSHDWNNGGSVNPEVIDRGMEMLRKIESDKEKYQATTDGGWPKIGYGDVLRVGMYDGWPYWRPVPSVLISGTLGPEWHSFMMLSDIREKK